MGTEDVVVPTCSLTLAVSSGKVTRSAMQAARPALTNLVPRLISPLGGSVRMRSTLGMVGMAGSMTGARLSIPLAGLLLPLLLSVLLGREAELV
jgi:hypothetical protein